jgi:ectoine hydroxylase-related dioxygenase (phytanoyl-CoA dioxygenase family)
MNPDPQLLTALVADGAVVVPGVLIREEALAMRSLLQQAIDEDIARWTGAPGYIDQWMVHNLMTRGTPFLELLQNPVLHAYFSALLGDTCVLYAYTSSSMPPRGANFSRRIHVDCPRVIPNYITNVGVTLALDDFTLENGATEVLLNSQWMTTPPSDAYFDANCVRMCPEAGEAIIFNARTWHRGGANHTDKARHAITMNVCRAFMRQRFDFPRLVPPELVEKLNDVGKRFLGLNVRVPASLEDYYVPEERRLYKAGQG